MGMEEEVAKTHHEPQEEIVETSKERLSRFVLTIGCMILACIAFSAVMHYNIESCTTDPTQNHSFQYYEGSSNKDSEYSSRYEGSSESPSSLESESDSDQLLGSRTLLTPRRIGLLSMGLLTVITLVVVVLVIVFVPQPIEQIVEDVEASEPLPDPQSFLQRAKVVLRDDITVGVGLSVMLIIILALHIEPRSGRDVDDLMIPNQYMSATEFNSKMASRFISTTDGASKILRMLQFISRFLMNFFPSLSFGNFPRSLAEGRAALRLFNLPSTILSSFSFKFKDMPMEGIQAIQVVALIVSMSLDSAIYFEAQGLFNLSDSVVRLINMISGWVFFVYIIIEVGLCIYQLVKLKKGGKRIRDDKLFKLKLLATTCDSVLALSRCIPGGFLVSEWVDILGVTSSLIGISSKVTRVRRELQPTSYIPE